MAVAVAARAWAAAGAQAQVRVQVGAQVRARACPAFRNRLQFETRAVDELGGQRPRTQPLRVEHRRAYLGT